MNEIVETVYLLAMISGTLFYKEEVSNLAVSLGGDILSMKIL
jgi:hypothetical protein